MSSATLLRWTSIPTFSLTRFSTLALTARCASRSSSSKWIRSIRNSGTSSRTSGGPRGSLSSRLSYRRSSRFVSLPLRRARSAGLDPFPLCPPREPERRDAVFFSAIRDSSSLGSLLRRLREVLQTLPSALSDSRDTLARSLPEARNALPGALPEILHALLGTLTDTRDSSRGSLTDVSDSAACPSTDAADRVPRVGEQIVSPAPHVTQRLPHTLEQLGTAVESRQHPRENLRDL